MQTLDSARRLLRAVLGTAIIVLLGGIPSLAEIPWQVSSNIPLQTPTLTGKIRQSAYPAVPQWSGTVRDGATGQTLAGVRIHLPSLGQSTHSNTEGRFTLPKAPQQPTIVSFSKPGYLSASVTVRPDSPTAFEVRLQRLQADTQLVLDDQLRHLGDNSYSPLSAGADRFRRSAEGTALVRQFGLPAVPQGEFVTLKIGTVLGLDTQAAHAHGQSLFHHASTPMLVKLNGALVNRIEVNGDGMRLRLPTALLRERNVLSLETGYNVPDGTYVDYDDVEVMHLVLEF